MQEIAIARLPRCFYGSTILAWSDVGRAAEWVIHCGYERYYGKDIGGVGSCATINEIRRDGLRRADGLLASGVEFKVTEPRDKIFGLLGLISHSSQFGTSSQIEAQSALWPEPYYSTSVASIYTQATRVAIASYKRLNVLRLPELNPDFAEVTGLVPDCPSWIPQVNAPSCVK